MPDSCPDSSQLAAWSDGSAGGEFPAESIERHVAGCARCGRALEALTLSRLAPLDPGGLGRLDADCDPGGASAALVNRLIEGALTGRPGPDRDPLPGFLAGLEPSSRPGSLGRFAGCEIEEPIGRGGMGVVFRAFDPTLQRRIAIKVLLHEGRTPEDDPAASRFLSEARAIAALRHEHVVEVYAAGRERGWPFLVMPFHAGGTLQQWVDQGNAMGPDDVIRIGIQLLRALEITHARGILHRDLKPSNVLLEHGLDHVRLADFGLAQPTGHLPPEPGRVIAGTPNYMSPEQTRGEALDARCDLFGLGAVLHHLLTGHPPRADTGGQAPATPVAGDGSPAPPVRTAAIPRRLQPVLRRLLAPRAGERYPDARTAREALEGLLRSPAPGRRRRSGLPAWAIGAGVSLAVLGLVVVGLEFTGTTALLNSLLCRLTGQGFYVRGRLGTYGELTRAIAACGPGRTVVARFDGSRPVGPVRVEAHGLRLQAASGFRPVLLATNASEPLFLALGPLVLEGLGLVSHADARDAGQLIAAEGTAVTLVHCRLSRLRTSADDVLVRSGRRLDPEQPLLIYKPLLTLRPGSVADFRHSLFLGLGATAVGLRGNGPEPIRIAVDQCLFAIHRTFALRPEAGTRIVLHCRDSAFASAAMLDLENAVALGQLAVTWDHCLLDSTGGVLLRWNRGGDGSWLNRLTWNETNVVYAGSGDFAFERRRGTISAEADWNTLVRLPPGSHRVSPRPLFGDARVRSTQRLEAADVDVAGLAADSGRPLTFRPGTVGEGRAYDRLRARPDPRGSVSPAGATPGPRIR